jgi:tRNA threonylcarbamoyl adenosine modification protein YeaZ
MIGARESGSLLAIDTATSRVVVARGALDGTLEDAAGWEAGYRHGEALLPTIERLLAPAGGRAAIGAIVVGTGPGAFTGLRVGIATAKGLAHGLGCPIVGVPSGLALLAALPGAGALLLPAGPSDRVLVRAGEPSRLLPGGAKPELRPGEMLVAVDL